MVTTIKITCDGVFIQSNSYLTRDHHRSHSVPSNTTQIERTLRQQPQILNGITSKPNHHSKLNGHLTETTTTTTKNSESISSDNKNSIVSCERAGHDKKFTISFLNSRQPVKQNKTSDVNNNVGGVKQHHNYNCNLNNDKSLEINNNNNNKSHKLIDNNYKNSKSCNTSNNSSFNNNTKRQLGISLSSSPPTLKSKSSSTGFPQSTAATVTKVENIEALCVGNAISNQDMTMLN
uniref:CSON008123 protein n=1 Tax=Culicoides sonorensis TaxID=179676 RepID=A0A336MZ98_CULSO